ncbi:Transcription factor PERIANTHIA [Sesamum angolense]|uniref:Transcription factor PERIANTHIA n=1 Tax=Sesamum angolense TaxID=2727404 RepID=A0AAE1WUK4_9LAMI|nr:Transcription factor PERIANTHIA [Sesamum angolense]
MKPVLTNFDDVYAHSQQPFNLRGDDSGGNGARVADLGELEQSAGNGFLDAVNLSRIYNGMKASNVSVVCSNLHFGGFTSSLLPSGEMGSSGGGVDTVQCTVQKSGTMGFGGSMANENIENWGNLGVVADHSQQRETSTDTDDKNLFPGVHHQRLIVVDSTDQTRRRIGDHKALRRLAQNREAAKKSRMRKKAYVQQLENSWKRLAQLEQDLKRARQREMRLTLWEVVRYLEITTSFETYRNYSLVLDGSTAFDIDYARWLDEHQRLINNLRTAVNSHVTDSELQLIVEGVMSHYDEIFQLKSSGAKSDIFHILSGVWKSPVERCLMWLGGSRSSEVLKILGDQIEPLTEQQLVGIFNLQQSSQQAEDALSQGMEALQQSLVETLSSSSGPRSSENVADYMGQMATAMSKLATLENFLHQADLLRLQTLQQLRRILTTRQAARALLAINDYKSRLRALSSLWLACPRG